MDHVRTLRLFDLARAEVFDTQFSFEEWEQDHLFQCTVCQDKLDLFIDITRESAGSSAGQLEEP